MFNLANKITLLRILMVPFVIALLYFESPLTCVLAALAFIFASLTDWADGYIARRENMVTSMGKFLDPLADKVLICSVLIMFVKLDWAPAWVVILTVCRELVVTGLRAMAIDENIVLAADNLGKLKTVLQIFAIVPLMLHYPYFGITLWPVGEYLLYVALILAIFSGVNYSYDFYRLACRKQQAKNNV
ncbi:MAG: CDP-diacylglycerol-glycerol-3-phosphate 3-phosphatidyltransferase [Candidatus Desulfovibrio kirbyi]|jgi:CDP-diacylglycerol--glycerol-3-phosphate 3-phosphatidyltransferase|uniref:CDP-diacylglycerol--glycerol-3-phosphate 3-phosphatidyltransferase n=1 Tax=Candidatus Desulfovibrio kirbyi TaxID=2696086 RepID=A0A6L2R5M7_9BACT|nr:CDP-diacylglycerol--glycerol-3-phosphate 3-phosphatidyltransferase [Desulfovibrio sp.]GFH62881.1 MAG: CDP-diacylglycerol-glycerol-3-phosphate 3-phosphatidyltransferase [Candidatus Desulfovibrio kirbyi]